MMFGRRKDDYINTGAGDTRQEVLEINYVKENQVLQQILKVSYSTKNLNEASEEIIRIIRTNYNIDYCTLFLYDENNFKVMGSNIDKYSQPMIEEFVKQVYVEKCENKETDAYVLKSEQVMNYPTGWERGIRYMMFSPLKIDNVIGAILIENTSLTLTRDEMEFFELIVENVALIIQNLVYFKKIVDTANLDGLTGVYNRHFMNEHLTNVIAKNSLTGTPFAIALFDIDHFKNFNDTYGHLHGDKVLKEVSKFMKKEIRTHDVLYRYGGEEFIIYFAESTAEEAYKILDKLREGISLLSITTDANEVTRVTASFGVCEFPRNDVSMQGLIEKADSAMYVSKESGRNRVTIYNG